MVKIRDDITDLSSMESPHRPRTYSHSSRLSVALSQAELEEYVAEPPSLQPHEPPDGGYGWCIVVAACFCNFVFVHNRISYGMFIPELTDYFSRSQTDMALVASVESIVRLISCKYRLFLFAHERGGYIIFNIAAGSLCTFTIIFCL